MGRRWRPGSPALPLSRASSPPSPAPTSSPLLPTRYCPPQLSVPCLDFTVASLPHFVLHASTSSPQLPTRYCPPQISALSCRVLKRGNPLEEGCSSSSCSVNTLYYTHQRHPLCLPPPFLSVLVVSLLTSLFGVLPVHSFTGIAILLCTPVLLTCSVCC